MYFLSIPIPEQSLANTSDQTYSHTSTPYYPGQTKFVLDTAFGDHSYPVRTAGSLNRASPGTTRTLLNTGSIWPAATSTITVSKIGSSKESPAGHCRRSPRATSWSSRFASYPFAAHGDRIPAGLPNTPVSPPGATFQQRDSAYSDWLHNLVQRTGAATLVNAWLDDFSDGTNSGRYRGRPTARMVATMAGDLRIDDLAGFLQSAAIRHRPAPQPRLRPDHSARPVHQPLRPVVKLVKPVGRHAT